LAEKKFSYKLDIDPIPPLLKEEDKSENTTGVENQE
jgi:hypothetical protein